MRSRILVLLIALVGLALPAPALAQTTDTVTVHLVVATHVTDRAGIAPTELPDPAPGTGVCDVTVPDGADGGVILDAAVEDGCIEGWDHQTFDGDRFVTSIDRWRAPGYTCLAFSVGICDWWEHHLNGESADVGIDGYEASDGDTVRWLYRNTFGDPTGA